MLPGTQRGPHLRLLLLILLFVLLLPNQALTMKLFTTLRTLLLLLLCIARSFAPAFVLHKLF